MFTLEITNMTKSMDKEYILGHQEIFIEALIEMMIVMDREK
jgi:hypothetical protein